VERATPCGPERRRPDAPVPGARRRDADGLLLVVEFDGRLGAVLTGRRLGAGGDGSLLVVHPDGGVGLRVDGGVRRGRAGEPDGCGGQQRYDERESIDFRHAYLDKNLGLSKGYFS
jgi:hypothetical protein